MTQLHVMWPSEESVGYLLENWASRSASDNIRTIIEKTESVYVQKFQRSVNGTLFSGEFSKSLTSKQEAVGAYFASGCIDQWV